MQNTFLTLLLCAICTMTMGPLFGKVRLLTFHFNKPELISLQHRAFKKFMQDDYELIVFNDAKTSELEAAIKAECERCGIKCVRYEQEWHGLNALTDQVLKYQQDPSVVKMPYFFASSREEIAQQPSVRHCHVIQYALEGFGYEHDDIVAIVDGDLFPMRPISLRQMMQNTPIVASMKPEVDVPYFWVTFIAMDMPKLPDKRELTLSLGCINGVMHDSGAQSYFYIKSHPEVHYKGFSVINSAQVSALDPATLKAQYRFSSEESELIRTVTQNEVDIDFQIEGRFLHMRGSHNEWYMQRKQAEVTAFFERLLDK
jgi:hypothetical protein